MTSQTRARVARGLGLATLAACFYVAWIGIRYYAATDVRRHHLEAGWMIVAALFVCTLLLTRRAPDERERVRLTRRDVMLAWAAFAAIACALYWRALSIGYLSDDFVLIELARSGRLVDLREWPHIRPAPLAMWQAAWRLGATPGVLHALNVLLHSINAVLVAVLAARVGLARNAALAAGLAFVVFPAHVEAVAWCSGVQDLLMTCGTLVVCVSLAEARARMRTAAAVGGLFLAMFSKETGVVSPLLALVALRAAGASLPRPRMMTLAGLIGCAGVFGALCLLLAPSTSEFVPLTRYALKELAVRPYAGVGAPWSDSLVAAFPVVGIVSVVVTAGAVAYAASVARSRETLDRIAWSGVWVGIAALPLLSFFYVAPNLEGSRYLYLPAVGWLMALAGAVTCRASVSRWSAAFVRAGLVAGCALSVYAVHWHLTPWVSASEMRDRVLAQAVAAARSGHCSVATFDNLPDSVEGAFVFRNGFGEALAAYDPSIRAGPGAGACALTWRDGAFVPR